VKTSLLKGDRRDRMVDGITTSYAIIAYHDRILSGTLRHYQQYFSYILTSALLLEETRENHRPVVSLHNTFLE
jgi:hypothetical protein